MSKRKGLKKIVWAVDAFSEDSHLQKATFQHVLTIARKTKAQIQPIHVLSPIQLDIPMEYYYPWTKHYYPIAEKKIKKLLRTLKYSNLRPPKIITSRLGALQDEAAAILKYGKKAGADVIALSTHAREGLDRFLLGSFAETLLVHSTVPVFAVNPRTKPHPNCKHILMPTDLSSDSKKVFEKTLALAKTLDAKLTLFFKIPNPGGTIFETGFFVPGRNWIPVQNFVMVLEEKAERELDKWSVLAKKQGMKINFVMDEGTNSIVDSILKYAAKNKVQLISMMAQSGPQHFPHASSITRQVVRRSTCPIWLTHVKTSKRRKHLWEKLW